MAFFSGGPSEGVRVSRVRIVQPDRRSLLGGAAGLAGVGLLGGCATAGPARPPFRPAPQLAPIRADIRRLMGITVCLRPFRAAGPRMDAETVGDKLVVHNYGHGGSGWSLSWGSAVSVVRTALAGGAKEVAVLGAGALGMTAATVARRAGANVTIYAKERVLDSRSTRATGVWSPDSRIALSSAVDGEFPARWEEMARTSWRMHHQYLGLGDGPVEWTERYMLADSPSVAPHDPMGFAHYGRRLQDIWAPSEPLEPGQHPFPTRFARRQTLPMFNITAYGHLLTSEFLQAGGRIETMEFHHPSDLSRLKETVIINCTGYGARALWRDESVVPVRGQIAWLIPQPEVAYGLYYKGVGTISRRDGMVVQYSGADESYGYNDPNEAPDRGEAERAIATIAPLFAARG
ncbi:D-amino-acid oxidase [Phenylobacterium kunshanense]|uniref:D-amino-acid oxidase n=2 Tax=Phenylobacterium kunshanense TaxID=1445034 RepID=A0A328BQ10_9CAUL|nr:D-amino-acid oxidase [Phenylobacterium kunshanense]